MKFNIKRRCLVRITSFIIAGFLVLTGCIIKKENRIISIERRLVHNYQSAMEELSSEMENMAISLDKALYVATPSGLSLITNEIALQASTASSALSSLPAQHGNLETLSKFLSQVSDYSVSLSKKVISGETMTDEERTNLKKLAAIARKLSVKLNETKFMYNSADVWSENIDMGVEGIASSTVIDTSFTETEQSLTDYPTLIYDGPFSDHIQSQKSVFLENKAEIDEKTGRKRAEAILNKSNITLSGNENGKIPAYIFSFERGSIAITKKGGYPLYFRNERDIKSPEISYEDAVSKAERFIKGLNLGEFETSYYFADEGVCVVNFAFKLGDVICYTDLIKVGVALDTGEVIFYEAAGYLMNHKQRSFKEPLVSEKTARGVVNKHLKILKTKLALIPSGGQNELYCYEFYCTGEEGEKILVYINTQTLAEEKILILLKTDGGTLTK